MSVRAKFKVTSITRSASSKWDGKITIPQELQTIKLYPVGGGAGSENAEFFASTPSGTIELGVVNPVAGEYFELDAEYYIDFTKASSAAS